MKIIQVTPEELQELIETSLRKILKEIKEVPQPEQEKVLTIDEAAQYLNLAKPTIYFKVAQRLIPFSKQGKRLYFYKKELDEWIKKGRKHTIEEIDIKTDLYLSEKLTTTS